VIFRNWICNGLQMSNHNFFLCWRYVLRWKWCLWCFSECISTPGKLEKYAWPRKKKLRLLDCIDIEGTRLSSEISHTRTDLPHSSFGRALC
jgi:hypothetical protein